MQKILKVLLISAYLTVNSSYATINQKPLTQHLEMVGQGEMSWLFIDLYKATLYSVNGQYIHQRYPQALNITYQKDIDKDHLISATNKEWQKLALDNEQHPAWLAQLKKIWPDIKKGDQLLFMVEQDGRGFFYHNDKPLGGINSDAFSDAFLAIWLSQNTSEPALRAQLLGDYR